jgi:hypothetical protein
MVGMTSDRVGLADALLAIIDDAPGDTDLPRRMCRACLSALPVEGLGLSLMGGQWSGARALLGASDAIGQLIEQVQFDVGEGPCLSAFRDGQPVLVPDLSAPESTARWPVFTKEMRTTPVRALFAFPLQIGAISMGVMECYRTSAGSLAEVSEALVVAETVTLALLCVHSQESEPLLTSLAINDHSQVHQATGMVAAQLEITPEEAFVRLRAYAYRHGRSLDEIGADVVARRLRFTDADR